LGVGKEAPLFVAEGIGRDTVRLGDLRGQLIVIDFWATWCEPCMAEMPQLWELYKEFSGDQRFVLLGLSLDQTLGEATTAVKKNGWPWPIAFAGPGLNSAIPGRYEVEAIPEKFVVDVDGKILYRGRDLAAVAKVVKTRLAELPPGVERRAADVGVKPVKSADDFHGNVQIAVALVTNNIQYRTGFAPSLKGPAILTWSKDGKPCREINEIGTSAWLSGPQRLAIDPLRQRLYYCDTFHKRLVAIDGAGQERFASDIPALHAAAVDERTGDIWCLTAHHLNSGELIILDEAGREKARHPITAFGIGYSPTEDAFWLAGDAISKMNREGRVLSRHLLDDGRYTFTDVAIDRERGGGWVLELDHPDRPRSKRQLWRIAPDGAAIVAHEFPERILPRTLVCSDGAAWVAAMTNYSRSDSAERQWSVQRFSNEGKPLSTLDARDIAVGLGTGALWIITGDQLCEIDTEGKKLLTIKLPTDIQSMQVAAF
jgi:thiol-disulfide isomerase/thioredoxin